MKNKLTLILAITGLGLTSTVHASGEQACANANGTNVLIASENVSASDLQNNSQEMWRSVAKEIQQTYGSNVNHTGDIGPTLQLVACTRVMGVQGCTDHNLPDIAFTGEESIEQAILDLGNVEEDKERPAAKCDPDKNVNTPTTSSSGGGSGSGGYYYGGGASLWPGVIYNANPLYSRSVDCQQNPAQCKSPDERANY